MPTNSRMDVAAALSTYASLYGQRLGQFIYNITDGRDIFYLEDDKLLELAAIYAVKFPPSIKGMP